MKKTTLILLSLLPALYVLAQANSNLTVSTTGTSNLRVKFNGKQYNLQDRTATFQNITPGTYTLVIYQQQIKSNGNIEYDAVFNNTVTLKPNRHVEVAVLRFGKTAWDESDVVNDNWSQDYNTDPIGNTGYNNELNKQPPNTAEFIKIKKAVTDQYFDADKLNFAKTIVKDNWLTADQVSELCKLFNYEDSKLTLAKFAYDHCVDKGNYFNVANTLYYASSKEELMKYIGSK